MPDRRLHRGAHPEDAELFASQHWPALRTACSELCWLLDRGYTLCSSLALTGDRHGLTQRQRLALARSACSLDQLQRRAAHRVEPAQLAGRELWIDGYNLLITIESALAGGIILLGRDGCYRDMASLHGTYRQVEETLRAAELIGTFATAHHVTRCRWLLDRPVNNSGRLRTLLLNLAEKFNWPWEAQLELSPDTLLSRTTAIVASSDSVILDRCERWCNAVHAITAASIPDAPLIDLRPLPC